MKKFKTFLKENTEPEQGYIDHLGRPCVVISHRRVLKEGTEPHKYAFHQWHDQNDNEESGHFEPHEEHGYNIGQDLHKDQGTHGGMDENNGSHHTLWHYSLNSEPLNSSLFRNHQRGVKIEDTNGYTGVKNMDHAVNQHALKRPLHVYSGVRFNPGEVAAKHPEGHIHLPAFTSTSIHKDTAEGFAQEHDNGYGKTRHIIHFHLPKGHKGVYIGEGHDGEKISEHEREGEFVLPRGTNWKIHPQPDIYEHHNGDENHVWHAHPVEENK